MAPRIMPKIVTQMSVRDINRAIDKASNALNHVMELTEKLGEKLDVEDADAMMLSASDDLESVHDDAEEADNQVLRLYDLTEKLQRYTRITRKRLPKSRDRSDPCD